MSLKWLLQKAREFLFIADFTVRLPKRVASVLVFRSGISFPICPRCNCTLDREYVRFCDRCGQLLSWEKFDTAVIFYAPRRKKEKSNTDGEVDGDIQYAQSAEAICPWQEYDS